MLSTQQLDLITATVPVLEEHGEAITRRFYERLFERHPEVRAYFSPAHQRDGLQQRALADAVIAFAKNIRHLENLGPAVERIGHKHVSLGVRPEHYPVVGENLLAAIGEVLGDAATPEIVEAWGAAYGVLSTALIGREAGMETEQGERFGWSGFRSLTVLGKTIESDCITSFILGAPGGGRLGQAHAGQYIALRLPDGSGSTTLRNYSLSSWGDPDRFRISVKREGAPDPAHPAGFGSGFLHDRVAVGDSLEVSAPAGDFFLSPGETRAPGPPILLLSGGVGVTPLLAMLHMLSATQSPREVVFLHCARTQSALAFRDEVSVAARAHGRTHVHVRLSHGEGESADSTGFLDADLIQQLVPSGDADVFLCGPPPFMGAARHALTSAGISANRIRSEAFGPEVTTPPLSARDPMNAAT